jgi:hypothetical protein
MAKTSKKSTRDTRTLEEQAYHAYKYDGRVLETGEMDYDQLGPVERVQSKFEFVEKPSWQKYKN